MTAYFGPLERFVIGEQVLAEKATDQWLKSLTPTP